MFIVETRHALLEQGKMRAVYGMGLLEWGATVFFFFFLYGEGLSLGRKG